MRRECSFFVDSLDQYYAILDGIMYCLQQIDPGMFTRKIPVILIDDLIQFATDVYPAVETGIAQTRTIVVPVTEAGEPDENYVNLVSVIKNNFDLHDLAEKIYWIEYSEIDDLLKLVENTTGVSRFDVTPSYYLGIIKIIEKFFDYPDETIARFVKPFAENPVFIALRLRAEKEKGGRVRITVSVGDVYHLIDRDNPDKT